MNNDVFSLYPSMPVSLTEKHHIYFLLHYLSLSSVNNMNDLYKLFRQYNSIEKYISWERLRNDISDITIPVHSLFFWFCVSCLHQSERVLYSFK